PLPENGSAANGRYRNDYFGLSYPLPAGWIEQPAGPPPSDTGSYVLTQFAFFDDQKKVKANVLVTAQDVFFAIRPLADAKNAVASMHTAAAHKYQIEREPEVLTIADRPFSRFAYKSSVGGLHWRVLATDDRCHVLTFTLTGTDVAILDTAERAMSSLTLKPSAPPCVRDYATGAHLLAHTDPAFTTHRFNTIPVRITVDTKGRVKHVHVLSAFPEQADAILSALRTWRLEPYRVNGKASEVETGVVFGMPR
ncbi:MAG: energy transducer TonB, partial [Acidobacteria bacterium]|nr:energy transducer TonB [Acidobacteriota bacterium]